MHVSKIALDIFTKTRSLRPDHYGIVGNITSSTRKNQVTKNIHISE